MLNYKILTSIIFLLFAFTACEKAVIPKLDNNPQAIFDELWQHVDENYIYFNLKQVDWAAQYDKYIPMISDNMTEEALFDVCATMLRELRDGHNVLVRSGRSNAYNFREGFDIHFDLNVVKNQYLNNQFQETGFFTYGILPNNTGYVHFSKFEGARRIRRVLEFMQTQNVEQLIFDVRNNSGGEGAEDIIAHLIQDPTNVGYTIEKTGSGRRDNSPNLSFVVQPADFYFDKPIALLTNRGSYSATTYFAAMTKSLPNVTRVGQITGGGGGGNAAYELQNGWILKVSVSTFLDVNFVDVEPGVEPDIAVNNDAAVLETGVDEMLERALEVF
ncbi:MAG: S41 family peptidase [Bacteroidota bacterium]